MGIELGTQLFETILNDTLPFGSTMITSIILIMVTLLIITRDRERWGQIALPVAIGWHISGITPHIFVYIITAIIFVITCLSFKTTATIMSAAKKRAPLVLASIQQGIQERVKKAAKKEERRENTKIKKVVRQINKEINPRQYMKDQLQKQLDKETADKLQRGILP